MIYEHRISTMTPDGSITISAAIEPDASYPGSIRAHVMPDRPRRHGAVDLSLTADQCRHMAEELIAIADAADAAREED